MNKQKVIFWLLAGLMILGLMQCVIDKTPLEIKEEPCWNSQTIIRDYEYIKNCYFFVDTFYVNYFEKGWHADLSHWSYNPSRVINEIEVYLSATYANPDAIEGLAVLNPSEYVDLEPSIYDAILPIPGEIEKSDFIKLQENVDYKYANARGFLWTNTSIEDNQVLAVSYKTNLDTIGTFSSEFTDTTKVPVFRLIKSRRMRPWYAGVWPLMMKNVYSLGQTNIQRECFNIRIEYDLYGEHLSMQQVNPRKSYLNLMGLDIKDQNGVLIDGGDGYVDENPLIINRFEGILIFPGLYPFNPISTSRFQIAETAEIYNTANTTDLQCNHKYKIIVTSQTND